MSKTVLVLGGPDTGKTHFTGQLYGRLMLTDSAIKLLSAPDDLGAIQQVLDSLGEGRAADHTPIAADHRMPWELRMPSGAEATIIWPDYGGEQLQGIFHSRSVPVSWVDRVRDSDCWLLFIRPLILRQFEDILTRRRGLVAASASELTPKIALKPWSDAAYYVELLQILLWTRHAEVPAQRRSPRLLVMLSCWDELSQKELPAEALRAVLPLFYEFLASNWDSSCCRIFGLSSLGKALSKTEPDQDFQDLGPDQQGYVVMPDGERSPDLTVPLAWLLEDQT